MIKRYTKTWDYNYNGDPMPVYTESEDGEWLRTSIGRWIRYEDYKDLEDLE